MRDEAPAVLTRQRRSERGVSLLETMVALSILMVGALGLLPLGLVAVSTTENEGHLVARTTEYAQDKMEQLLALAYSDTTTDTRVFPALTTGGTGLFIGGSADPATRVAGYVDYLNPAGDLIASVGTTQPAGWFYMRVWQISAGPSANMKQVRVTTIVAHGVGAFGRMPQSTLSALKTSPF